MKMSMAYEGRHHHGQHRHLGMGNGGRHGHRGRHGCQVGELLGKNGLGGELDHGHGHHLRGVLGNGGGGHGHGHGHGRGRGRGHHLRGPLGHGHGHGPSIHGRRGHRPGHGHGHKERRHVHGGCRRRHPCVGQQEQEQEVGDASPTPITVQLGTLALTAD
ncbi:hypothetical protein ACJRO7_031512 [Eucalyptus globulus]|uniref:Uncharacterized protein n=1 Tax=Eucalyptus globulus TaxID=34317 RepID=A0ABD3JSY6_EUCGL